MDPNSAEDSRTLRVVMGLALVVICLSLGFRYAHDRSLAKVNSSLTGGFLVLGHVGSVMDDLDRLSIDQRAYLSNGDERFSEDLVESVMDLRRNMESLKEVAGRRSRLTVPVAKLDRHIGWVLNSLGQSFDVQRLAGGAAAIAYLDADTSIDDAKSEAQSLKDQATAGVFNRVRSERRMKSILEVLF
jgi:hypothetical protein